MKSKIEAQTV